MRNEQVYVVTCSFPALQSTSVPALIPLIAPERDVFPFLSYIHEFPKPRPENTWSEHESLVNMLLYQTVKNHRLIK